MSGGSYDYAYNKVHEFADHLELGPHYDDKDQMKMRRQFVKHLRLVAEAMRAIEWVDSSDSSAPEDTEAIRKALTHRNI